MKAGPSVVWDYAPKTFNLEVAGFRFEMLSFGYDGHAPPFQKCAAKIFNGNRTSAVHVHDMPSADIEHVMTFLA